MSTNVHAVRRIWIISVVGKSFESGKCDNAIIDLLVQLVLQDPRIEVTIQAAFDRNGPVGRKLVPFNCESVVEGLEVEYHVVERTSHDTTTASAVRNSVIITIHSLCEVAVATKTGLALVENGAAREALGSCVQRPVHVWNSEFFGESALM